MRNALGVLAFGLVLTSISAFGGDSVASLSVSWKSITVKSIEKVDDRANETAKTGVIDLDLNGGKVKFFLGDLRLEGNRLVLNRAQVEVTYTEIKGKNVLIVDIPETISVGTVRREKKVFGQRVVYDEPVIETRTRRERKETALFSFANPGIVIEKRPEAALGIVLPREWKLKVSSTGLEFQQLADVRPLLHKAVDEGLTDEMLAKALDYRLVNVPGEIAPFVRGKIESEKPALYAALRAVMKQEMEKATFWEDLQNELGKEVPALDLNNQILDGRLMLSADSALSTLNLGAAPTVFAARSRFDKTPSTLRVAANASGMNLALRSFLNGLAKGHKIGEDILQRGCSIDGDAKVMRYSPSNHEERQDLANVFGPLLGFPVDAKDLDAIGIELAGQTFPAEINLTDGKKIGMAVGIVVYPRSAAAKPLALRVLMTFGTDDSGALRLESLASTKGKVAAQRGTMLQSLEAAVKLPIVRMLLNNKLQALQTAGGATQAFTAEVVRESGKEPVLVFRAH